MANATATESHPGPPMKIYGKVGCSRAYAIRDFLHRNDVPFEWIELKTDDQCRAIGVEPTEDLRTPVCVFPDGTRLECPTVRQIIDKLGWFHDPLLAEYDLAIYGGGPAGLSAAVYAASEGLKTVLIERWAIGGQAGSSPKIENYLGFPTGISGADLAERAREQARKFGVEILLAREGVRGEFTTAKRVGYLADGTKIIARAAICATGIEYRKLGLENEDKFYGQGVYYGAGASEAELCEDEHVFMIGGGNSAGQASMHFAKYAKKVTVVVRGKALKDTLSRYLVDRIMATKNMEVLTETEVTALHGDRVLDSITLRNKRTGTEQTCPTKWLFVCIGGDPRTEWAIEAGLVRDDSGYLVTGPDLLSDGKAPQSWPLRRSPYFLETNVPGMFAAGDVRHGSVKRCASAVGEGAMSVMFVHRYLAEG
ncbi:MAG TPA: FAD-dependent oxidoreductase [Candidatus Acidoferrales bacterium]|nr:FAD-dependent oxidoreductase [Candidatus Acidoferrales bacterium]